MPNQPFPNAQNNGNGIQVTGANNVSNNVPEEIDSVNLMNLYNDNAENNQQ